MMLQMHTGLCVVFFCCFIVNLFSNKSLFKCVDISPQPSASGVWVFPRAAIAIEHPIGMLEGWLTPF